MSTTETTGPEGPERGPEPGPIRYSVAVAAARLGISERAVRKRIQAGTLAAEPHGRTYWVYLQPGPEPGPDRALSAERETAVVNLVQQMIEPFVKELGETKELLGRVTAERDQAQRDRDALQARLSALEAQQAESPTQASSAPETATARVWWRFWER